MSGKLSIEIDLTTIGVEQDPDTEEYYPGESLAEKIIESITARVAGAHATGAAREAFNDQVTKAVDEVVKEFLGNFLKGEIQRYDRYGGTPVGEPTTIREMALTAVGKYLAAPPAGNDRYREKNLGDMVDAAVAELLKTELKPAIDEARKAIKETVMRQALEGAVAALSPSVKDSP